MSKDSSNVPNIKGDWTAEGDYEGVSGWIAHADKKPSTADQATLDAGRAEARRQHVAFFGEDDMLLGNAYASASVLAPSQSGPNWSGWENWENTPTGHSKAEGLAPSGPQNF